MSKTEEAKKAGALFYAMPEALKPEMIDPLLRLAVASINASGWVWTAESCQGHPDATEDLPWSFNTKPMLRLVVERRLVGDMLEALVTAAPYPDLSGRTIVWEVIPRPVSKDWWSAIIYAQAINVVQRNEGIQAFERFAGLLHPPGPDFEQF